MTKKIQITVQKVLTALVETEGLALSLEELAELEPKKLWHICVGTRAKELFSEVEVLGLGPANNICDNCGSPLEIQVDVRMDIIPEMEIRYGAPSNIRVSCSRSFDCVLSEDILAAAKDAVAKMLFNDLKDTD
tara:strand:- start:5161 stop:5559 length:399 start_codon:yes stop_codon:yes gene_type:complete